MHRRHAQSVYDAALLEYNNSIRESLSTAMHPHSGGLLLRIFFLVWIPLYLQFVLMMVVLHMTHLKSSLQFSRVNQHLNHTIFAFKSSKIKYFLKDNVFKLFMNQMDNFLAPKLNFHGFFSSGCFIELWRILISKGSLSSHFPHFNNI